jgi:hypothetical protein
MNGTQETRRLQRRPDNPAYVHRTPEWLVAAMRITFAAAGIATGFFTTRDWPNMPLPFLAFAIFLAPAFLGIALWPKPWRRTTKFMADRTGLYFPHNTQLVLAFNDQANEDWLHVPWSRIENLRLSTEIGEEGATCVAFDVEVSKNDREQFFKHVGTPRDRPDHNPAVVYAAYDDSPPFPRITLEILNNLRNPPDVLT